jgi:hypothetical protein
MKKILKVNSAYFSIFSGFVILKAYLMINNIYNTI